MLRRPVHHNHTLGRQVAKASNSLGHEPIRRPCVQCRSAPSMPHTPTTPPLCSTSPGRHSPDPCHCHPCPKTPLPLPWTRHDAPPSMQAVQSAQGRAVQSRPPCCLVQLSSCQAAPRAIAQLQRRLTPSLRFACRDGRPMQRPTITAAVVAHTPLLPHKARRHMLDTHHHHHPKTGSGAVDTLPPFPAAPGGHPG